MLILSAKKDEEIVLVHADYEAWVKVLEVSGSRVTLGFKAPSLVTILRKKFYVQWKTATLKGQRFLKQLQPN